MAENKTKPTAESVNDFIGRIENDEKRKDSLVILDMMKKASGEEPVMWGSSLIGFGYLKIKSPSGREVEWFRIGFSPRKANFSLYLSGSMKNYETSLKSLGKHKTGMGCLYINKLSDVNQEILKSMIHASLEKK